MILMSHNCQPCPPTQVVDIMGRGAYSVIIDHQLHNFGMCLPSNISVIMDRPRRNSMVSLMKNNACNCNCLSVWHGCQTAVAGFLDRMCLAPSGLKDYGSATLRCKI